MNCDHAGQRKRKDEKRAAAIRIFVDNTGKKRE